MLTVTEIGDASRLGAFEDDWRALCAASPDGSFFETCEWLTTFIETFWAPRELALMFVSDDHGLVGFAPFLVDDDGDAWCRRTLTLPYHPHVPRANIVAADGARRAVLDAVMRHVSIAHGSTPTVLPLVDGASGLWHDAQSIAEGRRYASHVWAEQAIPWIRLDGDWDSYLATRTSHVRSELRRKRRKLEKAGRLEIAAASSPSECDAAMRDILDIESRSWKQQEGTSFTTEAGVAEFYATLARRAGDRGWLRLYVMRLDGKPIAHIYGVVYKNEYLALKTSYDQAFRELSPGSVIFELALQDAFARGYSSFDLLGVEARWKNEIATDTRLLGTACLFPATSLRCGSCRAYECTVKPYLREHASWLWDVKRRLAREHGQLEAVHAGQGPGAVEVHRSRAADRGKTDGGPR